MPGSHLVWMTKPGICVSLETSYATVEGALAPGVYNIEDSLAIRNKVSKEDGFASRFNFLVIMT